MKQHRFLLCSTLVAALLFSSGCADKEDDGTKSNRTQAGMTTVSTTILPGEIGTEQTVDGAVVTLNGVYRSSFENVRNGYPSDIIFFSFTVTNNTDAPIAANFSQTCEMEIDGEPSEVFSAKAISSVFKQFGSDAEMFVNEIPAGETVTGYIGAEMYRGYKEASLLYTPLAGGTSDNKDRSKLIRYTFHPEDLEYIGDPVVTDVTAATNSD
ncbi:MAG: hypothetical protein Q4D37_01230 [Oscillospiraceae bacterium]|nr:hypothetical protein [Oscillospiraceae bacterium]